MSAVLALIPARMGSKGIPNKNWKPLVGVSCVTRAGWCAQGAGITRIVVSADDCPELQTSWSWLERPAALAQDDTPMVAVVKHVLEQIPGPPDQIIVLLQPTQPLRTPAHVQAAITLLQETQADSVVSVVALPLAQSPDAQIVIRKMGQLEPYVKVTGPEGWWTRVYMRQHCEQTYIRDGTCYAFFRRTVETYGNIYGQDVRALIMDAAESCPLDTEADWIEAERRLRERER